MLVDHILPETLGKFPVQIHRRARQATSIDEESHIRV
jgi:hypothetical protein